MLANFNSLPPAARVWVYAADRKLNQAEQDWLTTQLSSFVQQWAAHGKALQAAFAIEQSYFVLVGVNQETQQATGCSIDTLTHFMQQAGRHLQVNFFDRLLVAVQKEGQQVKLLPYKSIKELVRSAEVTANDTVYNHVVSTKQQLDQEWKKPAAESWIGRFFKSESAVK